MVLIVLRVRKAKDVETTDNGPSYPTGLGMPPPHAQLPPAYPPQQPVQYQSGLPVAQYGQTQQYPQELPPTEMGMETSLPPAPVPMATEVQTPNEPEPYQQQAYQEPIQQKDPSEQQILENGPSPVNDIEKEIIGTEAEDIKPQMAPVPEDSPDQSG